MLKIMLESKASEEEQIIKANEEDALEGEFYYMSTRYKSLIPLINEVKSQRGELQNLMSAINNTNDKVDKIIKWIKINTDNKKKK
mgnify:FL=1